jgi:nucleotide-binding universal stress UspA family protein
VTPEHEGAVIVGHIPGGNPAVLRYASALAVATGMPLIVAHVDTSRVIDAPEPDDAASGTAISEALRRGRRDLAVVRAEADLALTDSSARWTVLQRVGDPAMALHDLAERTHASMFVIGTRRDEIGAAVREFLNGSVALRLARHQSRPVVIVPTGVVHPWRSRTLT